MDEITELKIVKRIIIITSILLIMILLSTIVMLLIKNGTTPDNIGKIKMYAWICLAIEIPIILIYVALNFIILDQNTIRFRIRKNMSREIPEYPPAICSYLYNKKNEVYLDYTATILNLEYKNYLKLSKNEQDEYSFDFMDNDIQKLLSHEVYTLQCVKGLRKFDISEFKEKINEDLITCKLLCSEEQMEVIRKKKSRSLIIYTVLMFFITFIELISTGKIEFGMYMIGLSIGCATAYVVAKNLSDKSTGIFEKNKNKMTKKGKKTVNQIIGFKRFLTEYTLIKERNIEYRQLLEQYIPYAMSLGEGKTVEKFIKNNEQYRDLIYRNKF